VAELQANSARQTFPWRLFTALVLMALAIRGGVLWGLHTDLQKDPDGYAQIAEGLIRTGVYGREPYYGWQRDPLLIAPTAYRPPAYPLLLVNFVHRGKVSPLRVATAHLVLGVASVLLTFHLARQWVLPPSATFVAGLLIACDPILLRQSTLVMTETLATFLAIVALVALTRFSRRPTPFDAALAGAALALCALCRPTFYVWLALATVVTALLGTGLARRSTNILAFLGAAAVVISPWAIRNYVAFDRPVISTTHGGYTLALGNNSDFYEYLKENDSGEAWRASAMEATPIKNVWRASYTRELEADRWFHKFARDSIVDQPAMFAWACLLRLAWLWSPLPQRIDEDESTTTMLLRYAVAIWYVAVFALAIVGIAALRRRLLRTPWLWGVLLCIAFTAVHTFYWTNLRMRAPLMPVVALVAAAGAAAIARRWRSSPPVSTM
jgi:hypothetical protein